MALRNGSQGPAGAFFAGGTRRGRVRRRVRSLAFGLAAALTAGACSQEAPIAPSIVVVSLDTLRADHLSVYGYARETSPVLDQFAREAVRFDQAMSQAPGTLPSHLTLLTSLFPPQFKITRRDGRNWNQPVTTLTLPKSVVTLAEVLRENGYRTAAFTGGGPVSARYGLGQGFDHFEIEARGRAFDKLRGSISNLDGLFENTSTPFAAASSVFVFIHTFDIHDPYGAPAPFDRHFTAINTEQLPRARQYLTSPAKIARVKKPITGDDASLVRGFYDNGIRATDAVMGTLFDALKKNGLYEDSIIVVLSDHGEEFLDHGGFGHGGRLYQEHLRVPLLVRLPGGARGGEVLQGPVGLVDVAPTLLDLAGIEIPAQFRGRSLKGLLEGSDSGTWLDERRLYADIPNVRRSVRSLRIGRWKLVESPIEKTMELYDLDTDPHEKQNLAASRTDELGKLREELSSWLIEMEEDAVREGTLAVPTGADLTPSEVERLKQLGYL
jgi:arylsulfatase A-like enzyme